MPFQWNKMENSEAAVLAAAPGVIVYKQDGQDDRSQSRPQARRPHPAPEPHPVPHRDRLWTSAPASFFPCRPVVSWAINPTGEKGTWLAPRPPQASISNPLLSTPYHDNENWQVEAVWGEAFLANEARVSPFLLSKLERAASIGVECLASP